MIPRGSVVGGERLRLFVAFRLPQPAVDSLARWQQTELGGSRARLVPPENLHVTVAFLGSRPELELPDVVGEVRAAAAEAPRPWLRASGYRETRSVGMVVLDDVEGRAGRFAADVQERLERLGVYRRERRPWLAHVTVLRFRERPRRSPPVPDLGEVSPSEAAVYHSVLRPAGARYEVLESVALGG